LPSRHNHRHKTHTVIALPEVRSWIGARAFRLFGLTESFANACEDLEFEPPERIFLDKAKGFYIQKYVAHGGIGICDLVLIYSLVPAYITVRGVAVPALGEKMLRG
jgi:hypothetical protein